MKSLQLLPGTHRQKEIVKVRFPYDLQLMVKLKKQKGVRWSQNLKSWYFFKEDFRLNTFYNYFNPLDDFYVSNSGTIHPETGCIVPLRTEYKENKHHKGEYIQ